MQATRHAHEYLPHVDGLRAIAVLAVIVFHAAPDILPGGFAGVDVFFVVSGFLITRIILGEQERGIFSLAGFWDRRVRRILPPLLAVLLATLTAGVLCLAPSELEPLSASAAAALFSVANIHFWHVTAGYFAPASGQIPLLHLWSLGVEEQFYLVYPLLLYATARFRKGALIWLLAFGVALSFALALFTARHNPAAGFYLPFSRAWELGAGCLLALVGAGRSQERTAIARDLAAGTGLTLIVASFFLVDERTPWPGLATLPVVLGTVAAIAWTPGTRVASALLTVRPLVGLGLVSYAAYLWHYPILVLADLTATRPPGAAGTIALIAISIGLAWLSYRFIETPARDRARMPARKFWPMLLVGFAAVALVAVAGWQSGGLPGRLPARLAELDRSSDAERDRHISCFYTPYAPRAFTESCVIGRSGPTALAILGDSHAAAVADGFAPLLKATGTRARVIPSPGCPPVAEPAVMSDLQQHCPAFTKRALKWVAAQDEIKVVALSARWPFMLSHAYYDNGEGGIEQGPPDGFVRTERTDRMFAIALRRTVESLLAAGKTVVLVYPVPEAGWNMPKYLIHAHLRRGEAVLPTISETRWKQRAATAEAMLDGLGDPAGLLRIRPDRQTCGRPEPGRCSLGEDGRPYYFDDDHLNSLGVMVMIDGAIRSQGLVQPLERGLRAGR